MSTRNTMGHDSTVKCRGFDSSERRFCSLAVAVASAALCVGISGCSAATGSEEELATHTQNLDTSWWRGWGEGSATPTAIDTNPAACANKYGFAHTFVRDSNMNFRGKTIAGFDGMLTGAWSGAIGNLQFWSSPTCTSLYPVYTSGAASNSTVLLAGKAFDNRIYVQLLTGDTQADFPNDLATPPAQTSWGQLSSTQFTGGSNGFPAVAANGSRMVLVTRNNNSIIAFNRALPFSPFSPWSGAQNAPGLPFSATGVPAITYVGASTNAFVVVVKSTTAKQIYWIKYNGTAWVGGWTQASLPHTLTSDPAIEWSTNPTATPPYAALGLYFRDETNQVVQTSVQSPSGFGSGAYSYIPSGSSTGPATVLGSPAATFGALESGLRLVFVRGYMPETTPGLRNSTVLIAEDKCGSGECPNP